MIFLLIIQANINIRSVYLADVGVFQFT